MTLLSLFSGGPKDASVPFPITTSQLTTNPAQRSRMRLPKSCNCLALLMTHGLVLLSSLSARSNTRTSTLPDLTILHTWLGRNCLGIWHLCI